MQLSGPTSFAPFIYEAMRVTAHSGNQFHLAVLIADGQVSPCAVQLPTFILGVITSAGRQRSLPGSQ